MAKQTNKTNHILNLLSGNGKKKEAGDEQGLENTAPPVVPRSKTRETAERSYAAEPVEPEAQVVVDIVDEKVEEKENEELVNSINLALEDELKEYEETKAVDMSVSEELPVFNDDLELSHRENIETEADYLEENLEATETVTENLETEDIGFNLEPGQTIDDESDGNEFGVLFNSPSVLTKEFEDEPEITFEDEDIPIEAVAHGQEIDNRTEKQIDVSPEPETKPETKPETEEKLFSPDPDLDTKEPSYIILNVMETLVDMFALEYMEKFKICTCDRCLADVKALALTKVSGKYVVVDKDAQQAMINFYEKKFKSDVIVELTKACITIDENPHH